MKRRADSDETSLTLDAFPEQAHSLSVNLGMLSLNSDSNQKHYLGSSSGRLFANLIGASPSSNGSESYPAAVNETIIISTLAPEWPGAPLATQLLRQRYCSLHGILRRELPPNKKEAQQLLHSYICWIHPDFPVLDPSSLLGGLDALYATFECSLDNDALPLGWPSCAEPFRWNGRLMTPADPEKDTVPMPVVAFTTFMALNIAAIIRVRSRNYGHAPERFYRAATEFSQDCFSQISLPSIQALVTLIIHSMLTPAEINLWILLHIASAQCIELGIHREDETEINNPEDGLVTRQIRRSIFYTIYTLDRWISAIQGRPLGFRDETFDVKIPQALPVAADAPCLAVHPSFSVAVVRYSKCQFELGRIVSDIKLRLYHLPGALTALTFTDDHFSARDRIEGNLKAWLGRMLSAMDPGLAGIDTRQRRIWQCKLQAGYHTAAVLLFQPSQVIRVPGPEQLMKCYEHACAIIENYQRLQDLQGLHYGWRAVQNIFAAGATVVYCFWMSAAVRQNSVATDLAKTLRACTNLLTLGGEWWPSARKGQHGFGSVVDLTVQRLFSAQGPSRPSKTPRLAEPTRWTSSNTGSSNNITQQPRGGHEVFVSSGDADDSFAPDAGGEVSASVPPWNADGEQAYTGAPWSDPSMPGDTLLDMDGSIPEVEAFLADFDRSRFSWTFPLDGSNEMVNPDHLPDYHF
jgi:hypothetical protein